MMYKAYVAVGALSILLVAVVYGFSGAFGKQYSPSDSKNVAAAASSYSDWSGHMKFVINNTSMWPLIDYPVKVEVPYRSGMNPDFSDVRFAAEDGMMPLNYWRERAMNGESATFWVKIPSFPAGSQKTFHLYYGNESAPSLSSGAGTFAFFDDAESGTASDKWEAAAGAPAFSYEPEPGNPANKVLAVRGSASENLLKAKDVDRSDVAVEARVLPGGEQPGYSALAVRVTRDGKHYSARANYFGGSSRIYKKDANGWSLFGSGLPSDTEAWHTWRLEASQDSVRFFVDGTPAVSASDPKNPIGSGSIGARVWNSSLLLDDMRVRPLILPEPTAYVQDASTSTPPPPPSTLTEQEQWFLDQHESVRDQYFAGMFGVWENPVAWWQGWYLRAYINMYEASKKPEFLRALNELLKIVANGNDSITKYPDEIVGKVMPGWGNTYNGTMGQDGTERHVSITLNGLYMYPMASFARIVKKDPSLQAEFSADADRYLEQIDDIYTAFKPYVKSGGPYPDGTTGEYYVYPDGYYELIGGVPHNFGGLVFPINMSAIPAEAYAEAYRATGKAEYAEHARKVANYIWWKMRYKNDGAGNYWLLWDYWPERSPGTSENLNHAVPTMLFAKTMNESGIQSPFNARRLQYLANTFTESVMLSPTTMAVGIDGSGGARPVNQAYHCADVMALQPYDTGNSTTADVYYACKSAMSAAGQDETIYLPVFANFYRYDPGR